MKTIFTTNQLSRCIKNKFLSVGSIFTRNLSRGLPNFNLNPVVSFDNSEVMFAIAIFRWQIAYITNR